LELVVLAVGHGLTFQWNRSSSVGAGSDAAITASDPTLDTFPIEVTEMNGMTQIADSFLLFNASGASFVQSYLLPEMRGAAQFEEDAKFFLSTGTHPQPATFTGLRTVTGVTAVTPGTNGDALDLPILNSLIRAMPARYRSNPSRLAFYLPISLADDIVEKKSTRETGLGDRYMDDAERIPGPRPMFKHGGIFGYGVSHLPTNETQGSNSDAGTVYLVHRDMPVIGDGLTIRIEPYRDPNFLTRLQVQQWVGLGYQFTDAIVRRVGVRPAVFS
jgi:hypothetical protein